MNAMKTIFVMLAFLFLAACGETESEKAWHGAMLVRICQDGTYIYRLKDGRFFTGGMGYRVEDPTTVCVMK